MSDHDVVAARALNDREVDVFACIGRGMSTREIAAALHLRAKTVETYRIRIKRKLGLANTTELTRAAVRWVEDASRPSGLGPTRSFWERCKESPDTSKSQKAYTRFRIMPSCPCAGGAISSTHIGWCRPSVQQ